MADDDSVIAAASEVALSDNSGSVCKRKNPETSQFDVVFFLPHMGRGGAQRVVSLVANAWAQKGKRICILTWDGNRELAHSLDSRVFCSTIDDLLDDGRSEIWSSPWWARWHRWFYVSDQRAKRMERAVRPWWPWRIAKSLFGERRKGQATGFLRNAGVEQLPKHKRNILVRIERYLVESSNLLHIDERSDSDKQERPLFSIYRLHFFRYLLKILTKRYLYGKRFLEFRFALRHCSAPVVMSLLTRTNLYAIAATQGLGCRVVISERNDPDLQTMDAAWHALRFFEYRKADAVTSNSIGILQKMSGYVPHEKLKLLPNPIVVPSLPAVSPQRKCQFVTVARLVHQKGIDLLLAAFAQIAGELPDWSLEIVGDGPEREALEADAARLGIAGRVTFHGYLTSPGDILLSSRIFVLPSRFEGMPNALLEAMAYGLAPIVTDCSPGPLECVTDSETGLVVPGENPEKLAAAMRRLATDEELAVRLSRAAMAYIKAHEWEAVEPQWLEVLGLAETEGRADENS